VVLVYRMVIPRCLSKKTAYTRHTLYACNCPMQMRQCVSFFTHQQANEHGLKVPVLWTGKKASKVLKVLAQSFILTYNRMKHEILLDKFFDFILLYHELLMLSTFL